MTNCAARIETNSLFSNIYFNNSELSGIQRIGITRGKGDLTSVYLDEGEEIIGFYGNYNSDLSHISALGFIVWTPKFAR